MEKKTNSRKPARDHEVRIKEGPSDDYFRRSDDPYVLPPEMNVTIKDGFRFGLGFMLATLVVYLVIIVGIIIVLRFGGALNIR